MSGRKTLIISVCIAAAVVAVLLVARQRPNSIIGAIVTNDPDPSKQLPVADVEVTVAGGPQVEAVRSDAAGLFNVPLSWRVRQSSRIMLHFRHPDYQPLDLPDLTGDKLYIARLTPRQRAAAEKRQDSAVTIASVVAQYSVNTTSKVNIGSVIKTFRVVNLGNIPCNGRRPCSPDSAWKAAIGSATIDAGENNELHNARASCIAGPCPFTRIENSGGTGAGDNRILKFTALNWSDTATFLVEAEVYKPMISDILRQSYPLVFDRALTFTLPAAAEGVSIKADLNGNTIVFPLGPSLYLSWADCQALVSKDQTKLYRCELKPGFRFL